MKTRSLQVQLPEKALDTFIAQRYAVTLNAINEINKRGIRVGDTVYPVKFTNKGRDFEIEVEGLYRTKEAKTHHPLILEALEKALIERGYAIVDIEAPETLNLKILVGLISEGSISPVARRR